MSSLPTTRAARGAATVARLLDAAAVILQEEGAASVSVQHVADAAGTSKGLVHYHFADKDDLLIACARRLTMQLVDDEGRALAGSTASSALGDLWDSIVEPVYRGRRRALLALLTVRSDATRAVLDECDTHRRDSAVALVASLERTLGFQLSVSRVAIAGAFMAFADGLCFSNSRAQRQSYDAFWLAVLSLPSS